MKNYITSNSDKHLWKDELLQILNLQYGEYKIKDIELQFIKISKLNGYKYKGYISLNNEMWNILKLPGWKKRVRLSYLMSHVIKKFIINNDRPTTKYYSSDFDFNYLDNNLIDNILDNL